MPLSNEQRAANLGKYATKKEACLRGHPLIGGRCPKCHLNRVRSFRERHPERANAQARKYSWVKQGIDPVGAAVLRDTVKSCQICGSPDSLVIDHDHDTGRLRGVLCKFCNQALGTFKDSEEGLLRALGYLRNAKD